LPHSAIGVLIAFGFIGGILLANGRRDYPQLHAILDTAMALVTGVLALLLWDMGRRIDRPFPRWLSIGLAVTFVLQSVHVMVTVDWTGALAPVVEMHHFLRPVTWPPAAHLLPIGVAGAIWLMQRGHNDTLGYAIVMIGVGAGLSVAFRWLPTYTPPGPLGITRPALILAPLLWAIVALVCWRLRAADRVFRPLTATAAVLLLGNVAMLYSQAPHDTQAMVAHLSVVAGGLVLLMSLMQLASFDMLERTRAEGKLARANGELEDRVLDRTARLEATNKILATEIAVRRQAEQTAQAQLARLNLLHQITHALGARQDLSSFCQVVVRSVEEQLPVDFACLCFYHAVDHTLAVAGVALKSGPVALDLAMPDRAIVDIDDNGLARCVGGQLVYEPDVVQVDFPFCRRLATGGLRSVVLAPLQVESQIFGVLMVARVQAQGFDSGECEFLSQLGEHLALVVHQAQL
jgi:GAF domain-containing protein